jgi:hypothetical protein
MSLIPLFYAEFKENLFILPFFETFKEKNCSTRKIPNKTNGKRYLP